MVAERGKAGDETEVLVPVFYLDFFRCSSSGSCTERAEAGIDQEKTEGHPSPEP